MIDGIGWVDGQSCSLKKVSPVHDRHEGGGRRREERSLDVWQVEDVGRVGRVGSVVIAFAAAFSLYSDGGGGSKRRRGGYIARVQLLTQ